MDRDQVQEIQAREGQWVVAPVEAAVAPAPQVPEELEAVARATPDLGAVASNY